MSNELYRRLLDVLGTQELTADQLHAQLNSTWTANRVAKSRVLAALRFMTSVGSVVRTDTTSGSMLIRRYGVALDAYRADQIDGPRWGVIKFDATGSHPTTIGNAMTEAEAKVCTTALNEHGRKVRGFKS